MSNHFVTVDVGGTKILAAVVSQDGQILARQKAKTDRRDQNRLIQQIGDTIDEVVRASGIKGFTGLAMGVPGVVDTSTGFVVLTPNAPLSQLPLGELMQARFKVPVIIGNDANLGIVGESWVGAARGAQSAFGIFVGTGIGGGLVLHGHLIEGFRGLGGEIGHLMIPLGADEIAGMLTKKHLFLEDLCSRTAIENQLRHAIQKEGQKSVLMEIVGDKKLERIRSGALKQALRRKDPLVTDVVRRSSFLLGLATASILHVVDPEVIVFGGGVIEACGDWMLPWIEKTAHKVAMPGTGKPLNIVRSELGDDAILLGGVKLLRDHFGLEKVTSQLPIASPQNGEKRALAEVDKPLPSR
jgi:glucokinase